MTRRNQTHARDHSLKYRQFRTIAVCGMRVYAENTIYAPLIKNVADSDLDCVGCRAILREREKEAADLRALS